MAGRFEAPKGQKGFIPEHTDARPGRDKKKKNTPPVTEEKTDGAKTARPEPKQETPQPVKEPAAPVKKSKAGSSAALIFLIVLAVVLAGSVTVMGFKVAKLMKSTGTTLSEFTISTEPVEVTTEPTEPPTTEPVPEHVVTTASIAAVGDLLMHEPVMASGRKGDGTYDFSSIFQYLAPTLSKYDYCVANLETTLAGSSKPYKGYPNFNCPDEIVKGAMDGGFDMLLTANNHCFDTGMDGYLRTLQVTKEMGVDTIGTMTSAEDPKYLIKDINGIKIGMICYTYETTNGSGEYPALNGLPMYGGSYSMINTFVPTAPEKMYAELTQYLGEMKEQGVEATILFIHWGTEYVLSTDKTQPVIAQGLANLGIDVIVGGHPHVVEPMALLQSETDPDHKTVCIYSLGNAVSNQRLGYLSQISTAHTEDGALFTVTFEKYSDGKVYMLDANVIPMWVNMRTQGARAYNILPLDGEKRDAWKASFDLTDTMMNTCEKSYKRTMDIVGAGLTECSDYLYAQKEAREEYYYDLAWHPEKFQSIEEETLTTEETLSAEIVEETLTAAVAAEDAQTPEAA